MDVDKIIKFYPGSSKGPLPQDDPVHYSEWFMRNQPVQEIYGTTRTDFRDIGVKWRFVYSKQGKEEQTMKQEYKDHVQSFIEDDGSFEG